MDKTNHIVFTTIFYPDLLWDLHKNLTQFGHLESTMVWVVGDRKTPPATATLCQAVTEQGLQVNYLGIDEQNQWGKRFPQFYARIPYDNETRRNIGYLHALEHGCQRLISIDDDNWPTEDDFIGGHQVTGAVWNEEIVVEPKQFHNVCEYLEFDVPRPIYPRGFPFRLRGMLNERQMTRPEQSPTVGVTAGLWLAEPDVDATTWLNGKILGNDYKGPKQVVLDQSTWSPINTQNTSVLRTLIPAYLCIPMGWDVPGGKIQRYGDIWGGYFLQAVMQGTAYAVAFGRPLVEHRRNPHDYLDDLRHEFWGMILTDWLLDLLRSDFRPCNHAICDRVDQLADFLLTRGVATLPTWCTTEVQEFIQNTAENLQAWTHVCRQLQ